MRHSTLPLGTPPTHSAPTPTTYLAPQHAPFSFIHSHPPATATPAAMHAPSHCNVPYTADLGNRIHRLTSSPTLFHTLYALLTPFRALYAYAGKVPSRLCQSMSSLQKRQFRLHHLHLLPSPSSPPPMSVRIRSTQSGNGLTIRRHRIR
jgi:hypothetical protein